MGLIRHANARYCGFYICLKFNSYAFAPPPPPFLFEPSASHPSQPRSCYQTISFFLKKKRKDKVELNTISRRQNPEEGWRVCDTRRREAIRLSPSSSTRPPNAPIYNLAQTEPSETQHRAARVTHAPPPRWRVPRVGGTGEIVVARSM